ncbi:uncharacterized protein [Malus domestica]|uniref:uncharacterized protein isoform X1 n=1 Tax=Malus domestica TaxID=3750 RepID=UPI003974F62A
MRENEDDAVQSPSTFLQTNMEEKLDNYPPKLSSYNYNTLKKKWSSNLKLQLAVAIGFIPFPQKLNVFTLRMIGELRFQYMSWWFRSFGENMEEGREIAEEEGTKIVLSHPVLF